MTARRLEPSELSRACDPAALEFDTTRDLEPLQPPLGQERAAEAIRLGISVRHDGYNVFVLGPPGAGKQGLATRIVEEQAARTPPPGDWCYLFDFADRQRPAAVPLPAGRAAPFRAEMERLVDELRAAIPALFESENYRTRLHALEKQVEERRETSMRQIQEEARGKGIALVRTPIGLALAPVKDGEIVEPDAFNRLPEEERTRIQGHLAEMQERLQAALRALPQLEREHRERVRELNREVALFAVGHLIDDVKQRYGDLPRVQRHLDAVQRDVVENVHEFLGGTDGEDAAGQMRKLLAETPALNRYRVNVLVDRAGATGAPVVLEDLPTHANLTGRVEHQAHFGTLVTDFTLVRAGALHRANGGFLLLDARRLLAQPFAWEDLKRALRTRQVRIEPPERLLGLGGVATLEPEPIPLDVKVVLLGERWLYRLLLAADPEFPALFKVAADFEDEVARAGSEANFARMVAALCRDEGLRPLDRGAAARVVERAARLAGDSDRLSAHLEAVADLLREASHHAGAAGREVVGAADVDAAVEAQVRRASRVQRRLLDEIARGTLLIDVAGARVGQVNGLAVYQDGAVPFGHPARITARVRMGRGEVVDIEREVELGGPIHSKGVMILAGFLGARYCADHPFTLSASLVFEQSYGGVEGDSASCAETCALLSELAGLPISQSLALTGSVNQLGQVQAIGGVNEKVEGFFDACRARGLTGEQGVLIPASNVKHLVLRRDVVEAAREGRFRVWAVETVDDAMELLTGTPAGERGPDGTFPEGTVNGRVARRLAGLAERARAFGAAGRDGGAREPARDPPAGVERS
jgi:predicted ATP-dependent protease